MGLLRGFTPCSLGGDHDDAGYHGAEKARVTKGNERGGPPVDPSSGAGPLHSANGFCE